jgi:hypothetical protein
LRNCRPDCLYMTRTEGASAPRAYSSPYAGSSFAGTKRGNELKPRLPTNEAGPGVDGTAGWMTRSKASWRWRVF